ncbi:MAG: signal peptidase I [Actinomycetia bacterium]|nr:signal peptidase I [Actinomycetes bacterium]
MTDKSDVSRTSDSEEAFAHDAVAAHVAPQEAPPSFLRWLGELVFMVLLAFVLATGIRTFVVQPYVIPTGSMIPTIGIGERVLANKFIYRFSLPEQGDIVVFDDPTKTVPTLIKRVIAVGGQTVDVHDGAVYVDGAKLNEPYTYGKPSEPGDVILPVKIPAGEVWLMGDNRTNSHDSRWFGPQPVSIVHGKAFLRYWPLNRFAKL